MKGRMRTTTKAAAFWIGLSLEIFFVYMSLRTGAANGGLSLVVSGLCALMVWACFVIVDCILAVLE